MKITLKFVQIQFQTWETLQKRANQVADFTFTFVEGHLWKAQWKEKPNDEGHKKLTMNS